MLKRIFKYFASAVIVLIAALLLGAIPFSLSVPDVENSDETVRIYVLSNGFHSDIAFPKDLAEERLPIRASQYQVDSNAIEYYAVGWGSKVAFTSLLAVSDLTPSIIARALAFDETVMHVTPLGAIGNQEGVYALDITREQAAILSDEIESWFVDPAPLENLTQGFGDRFYASRGHFAPWSTCNSWTGRRLRSAGIAIGIWTPLAQSLEFGLEGVATNP